MAIKSPTHLNRRLFIEWIMVETIYLRRRMHHQKVTALIALQVSRLCNLQDRQPLVVLVSFAISFHSTSTLN